MQVNTRILQLLNVQCNHVHGLLLSATVLAVEQSMAQRWPGACCPSRRPGVLDQRSQRRWILECPVSVLK